MISLNVSKIWVEILIKFWKQKDIESIIEMFEKGAECYDTPFVKSNDVENDWEEIKEQDIVSLTYEILSGDENNFVVNFKLELKNQFIDVINHIKLNKSNKCYYLKQWYMEKQMQ